MQKKAGSVKRKSNIKHKKLCRNEGRMKTILFVDSCVRGEQSRTRKLAMEYMEKRKEKEEYKIENLKLYEENLSPLTMDDIIKRELDKKEKNGLCRFAFQFSEADEIVIAAPYWDLSFPSILKVYFEQVCIGGITFQYQDNQCIGICKASRIIYITSAGGFIGNQDFGSLYVKELGKMLGISEFISIKAEGLDIDGADIKKQMEEAGKQIDKIL